MYVSSAFWKWLLCGSYPTWNTGASPGMDKHFNEVVAGMDTQWCRGKPFQNWSLSKPDVLHCVSEHILCISYIDTSWCFEDDLLSSNLGQVMLLGSLLFRISSKLVSFFSEHKLVLTFSTELDQVHMHGSQMSDFSCSITHFKNLRLIQQEWEISKLHTQIPDWLRRSHIPLWLLQVRVPLRAIYSYCTHGSSSVATKYPWRYSNLQLPQQYYILCSRSEESGCVLP